MYELVWVGYTVADLVDPYRHSRIEVWLDGAGQFVDDDGGPWRSNDGWKQDL